MPDRYVVIMAGGRGERFWPQSRLRRPKQLLPIVGDKPMLAQTLERLEGLVPMENIFVLTNAEQLEATREVCAALPAEHIVGEPVGRDTAPAVGLAALLVQRQDPEAAFAMLPADAVIHDDAGLRSVLDSAFAAAEAEEALVTVGIRPQYAATGYGYIQQGKATGEFAGRPAYVVERFVEKPDEATAKEYLESGNYYWNAGMFIWRAGVIAKALAASAPDLANSLRAMGEALDKGEALESVLEREYPDLEKISIDYAVMEKAKNVLMVESAFDWDDVGEWPALERHCEKDEAGNVVRGRAVLQDARGNLVVNEGGHLTAVLGANDLIIVQTKDATLVCPKDRAQDIKQLVKELQQGEDTKGLV